MSVVHHREPGGATTCGAHLSRRWFSALITSNGNWASVTCRRCQMLRPADQVQSKFGHLTKVINDATTREGSGDFSIGGDLWPGLSKLIEEAGETSELLPEVILVKVLGLLKKSAGKLIGSEGRTDHWSGDLVKMLTEELGDLGAARRFFIMQNPQLDPDAIEKREAAKLATFIAWHQEGQERRHG